MFFNVETLNVIGIDEIAFIVLDLYYKTQILLDGYETDTI